MANGVENLTNEMEPTKMERPLNTQGQQVEETSAPTNEEVTQGPDTRPTKRDPEEEFEEEMGL